MHLAAAVPFLVWVWLNGLPEPELIGDEGTEDGPVGDGQARSAYAEEEDPAPMAVSLYTEAAAAPVETIAEVATTATAPAPGPKPANQTAAASGGGGNPDGDPTAEKTGKANLPGRPPRGAKKPCDEIDEISALGADKWKVEREIVTYYAFHQSELMRQVNVAPHFGPDRKPDGAWIFLPRCSYLKQAGIRHKDVVHSVNGKPVRSLAEGVAAYIALIGEENLKIEVTRKGERKVLRYRLVR